MHVIVTGATSFVGAAAIKELLKKGHVVTAVVRPASAKLNVITSGSEELIAGGKLRIVENDLSETEKLPEKITAQAEVFCHFGWDGSGSGARNDMALQKKNYANSLKAIGAAKALGCKTFLFAGSQAECGLHETLITEESGCSPRSLYGEAKLKMRIDGEALCRKLGLSYVHARIFSAYGPGDHPWTLVESCVDAALQEKELSLGACTQQWNFLYIEDLGKAICALAETPHTKLKKLENPVFNLAGSETKPLREFVEIIQKTCGGGGCYRYGVRPENAEGAINLMPSIEKIQEVTGWRPETDFETGIRNVVAARE